MALTTLDSNTAVVVVDLQKGLAGSAFVHPFAGVVARARELIDGFRRERLPVVLVNVDGVAPGRTERRRTLVTPLPAGFTDFVDELGRQADDIVVTKRSWGPFATTDLQAQLEARGVTQLVVAGVATATGVEATARQAFEAGFNVTLAVDAMTDSRREAHDHSLREIFPRLGETGAVSDILDLLKRRG